MRRIVNIVVALLCLFTIVYHFVNAPESETLFGFEVSNWIFLGFWGLCLFGSVASIINGSKKPS